MGEEVIAETSQDKDGCSDGSDCRMNIISHYQVKDRDGCKHYRRKARLIAPCCDKVYTCRFCHDTAEDHAMKRHMVEEMVCSYCETRQPIGQDCEKCGTRLGKYFCAACRLHDDVEKHQFHCEACDLCYSGPRDNFFHCDNCVICLANNMKNNHKCVKGVGRSDCCVCLEDIQSLRSGAQALPCGHLLHISCFREMVANGIKVCPKCKVSIRNRRREWERLDDQIRHTVLPPEERHCYVLALCNDCHHKGRTKHHSLGLKCTQCGSYNTVPAGPLEREEHTGLSSRLVNSMRKIIACLQ